MPVIVTGSIGTDYLMRYPGHFMEHIIPSATAGKISVSFLVEDREVHPGGIGPNICYSLALLGLRPRLMGTAGTDWAASGAGLEAHGVDISLVRMYAGEFTATFTVITDLDQNQVAGFHAGAMSRARELSFRDLDPAQVDLVIISPNDPQAMHNYAAECQAMGIPFIYDPSQQLARMDGAEILTSMKGALALTVNDYEFELIKNKTGLDEAGVLDQVRMLAVTRGAEGASLMSRECRVDVPSAPPAAIVDPTGVGDAFRAGLIVGLVRGYSWAVTGRLGALAATYVLEQSGTMSHRYTLPEFVARYRATFGDAPELADLLARAESGGRHE